MNPHTNMLLKKERSQKSQKRIEDLAAKTETVQILLFGISFVIFVDSPEARCADSLIDPHFLLRNANTHIWSMHGHTEQGAHTHTHKGN